MTVHENPAEHVRLVEDKYWFYRYAVDPVDGVTSELIRSDKPAAWGSTTSGHYAEIALTLRGKKQQRHPALRLCRKKRWDFLMRMFSRKWHPFFRGKAGVVVWSSLSAGRAQSCFTSEQIEMLSRLLVHSSAGDVAAVRKCQMVIDASTVCFELVVRHETGTGVTRTQAQYEAERAQMIGRMDPYRLAVCFQSLVAM